MEIGYGSVSAYDSLRYKLYFDDNMAYFIDTRNNKYLIKLDNKYIQRINKNKKIWTILSQLSPKQISDNNISEFKNPRILVL